MNIGNPEMAFAIVIVTIVFLLLSTSLVIYGFIYQRKKEDHNQEIEILKFKSQQALLQTQIEIQEQTLKTISQEIHDNIGQVLSLAKLNLNTFEDIESSANQTKINDTKNLVSKAINDLRDLSRSLYGNKIAELGLVEAIDNELKILRNSGQFKTSLKINGNSYKLEPQKEMVLFRMVQESLNNIIKHSKAQNITVLMEYDPGVFKLTITDDGVGFETDTLSAIRPGIGFKSMQNRASLIGGLVSLTSTPGKGTTITLSITGILL